MRPLPSTHDGRQRRRKRQSREEKEGQRWRWKSNESRKEELMIGEAGEEERVKSM